MGGSPATPTHAASNTTAAGKAELSDSDQTPLKGLGPLKSLAAPAEAMKRKLDVTYSFVTPVEQRVSSGSKAMRTAVERVLLEPQTKENRQMKAGLEVKEDENLTGAKRRLEEMKRQIPR